MIQPPTEPIDLTPPEDVPVVRTTVRNLDEVAAIVGAHDGKSRAVISLEGTDFQVALGPRRPLVYKFSAKEKRELSEDQRAELLAKLDRDLFASARAWAVRELRALPKGMRRKVHPPRKVAPVWEETILRRQLAEAQGDLSAARRDLAEVRGHLDSQREAYNAAWSDLEAARARLQVLEVAGDAAVQEQCAQDIERLEEKNEELEGRVHELETELESAASEAAAQGYAEGREEVLLELGVREDMTLADRLELEAFLSAFEERRRCPGRKDRTTTFPAFLLPLETEEKGAFILDHWDDLPLAALRWVVEENRRP